MTHNTVRKEIAIMKNLKQYLFGIILCTAVLSMTACGDSNDTQGTSPTTTAMTQTSTETGPAEGPTTDSNLMDESSGNGSSRNQEESTGVIDGMMNDVEKGVDDMVGESSSGATDSTNR